MARAADNCRQSIYARTISSTLYRSPPEEATKQTCANVLQIRGEKFTKSVTNRTDGYTLCALSMY
jgi:hypothetical protein